MSAPTLDALTASARGLLERTSALLVGDPGTVAADIAQFATNLHVIHGGVTAWKVQLLAAMQRNPNNAALTRAYNELASLEAEHVAVREGWLAYVEMEPLPATNGDPEVGIAPLAAGVVITVAVAALGVAIACSAMGVAWAYAHWEEVARQRDAIEAMRTNPALAPYLTEATKPAPPPPDQGGSGLWVVGALAAGAAAAAAWWWSTKKGG